MQSTTESSYMMDDKGGDAAELLVAAEEGQGDVVMRILTAEPDLMWIGDTFGNTVFHLAARAGHVDVLKQLTKFFRSRTRLEEMLSETNMNGETVEEVAAKTGHELDPWIFVTRTPCSGRVDIEMHIIKNDLLNDGKSHFLFGSNELSALLKKTFGKLLKAVARGEEEKVESMLGSNPGILRHTDPTLGTSLHVALRCNQEGILRKLVRHLSSSSCNEFATSLVLTENRKGLTPLQLTIESGYKEIAHNLTKLAPQAAFKVDENGVSPLYLAVEKGYVELVRYMFQLKPGKALTAKEKDDLMNSKKFSIPHAALRARNFAMLQVIMEELPILISSMDRKGWKPFSYATFQGYLEEVMYFIKTFPDCVTMRDSDGYFPIHKAISGGHVDIVKEILSSHPQTLCITDKKSRSLLHIAVVYGKSEVLSYLVNLKEAEKIFYLKNDAGKTFKDVLEELKLQGTYSSSVAGASNHNPRN